MAALDNAGSAENSGMSTLSFAFTTTGANRALQAAVHIEDDPTAALVSAITYAGVSMGAARTSILNANYTRTQQFVLAAPALGSNTLAVTLNNAAAYGLTLGAISATNVDQTTPVRALSAVTASADNASPAVVVPSAVDDLVLSALSVGQSGTPGVAPNVSGTGHTRRYNQEQNYIGSAGSTIPGAASVNVMWTTTGIMSPEWALAALSLADAGAGGIELAIGLNTETDSAFPMSWSKLRTIGLNTETDSVLALSFAQMVPIGLVQETDSVLAVTRRKTQSVGLNTETDSVLATTRGKALATGLNTETDSAFAVARLKRLLIGLVAEVDSAFQIVGQVSARMRNAQRSALRGLMSIHRGQRWR